MVRLPAQPHQSLIDGLAVLQSLAVKASPVSCKALAEELGQEVTRVNRMLKTLSFLGLAHQTKARLYTGGPGMHVLAAQSMFGSGLIQKSIPILDSLTTLGFIVALGVLWNAQVSYLYHWTPGLTTGQALGRIALYPASGSSIGIVLLSKKSDEEIANFFPKNNSLHKKVMASVHEARQKGYAVLETAPKVLSLAVQIGEPAYAALALSGKIAPGKIPEYAAQLQQHALTIEQSLNPEAKQ